MRNALAVLLVLASLVTAAACGKKQAPQSPANNETQAAPDEDREEQDVNKPDDTDSDSMRTSDPCEGGE